MHRRIQLSSISSPAFSQKVVDFYEEGHSVREICKLVEKPFGTVHKTLVRAGIELRSAVPEKATDTLREIGKRSVRPPYGFCFFQGKIAPDPREYDNLLLIHRLWKKGINPNSISDQLNAKKIPSRIAKKWNRNSVVNIVERFESQAIVIKGTKHEFR